jgi:single-stranded DNA-binding protein
MSDVNKYTGTGRLGVEPKIITTEAGTKVGKLFALLNDNYVDRAGREHKETLPVNIVVLRPADVALVETLHTGASISWEGKLARRTFEKDGKEQAVFEIVIAGAGAKLEAVEPKASGASATGAARDAIGKREQQASAPSHNQ